ncbi:hypothetical protein EMIT0P260_40396 [Pseudomonas sp. IT-P260]
MGASLLAKAVYQSTYGLSDMASSRAGSLPHWFWVNPKIRAQKNRIAAVFLCLAFEVKRTATATE